MVFCNPAALVCPLLGCGCDWGFCLYFSLFLLLVFFFLSQIKRHAGMRVQFSVYISWKTLTHWAYFSPKRNISRHKIGFDLKQRNKTGNGQYIGFIDHNIIMYIKIPCGDSGILYDHWATVQRLLPPTAPNPCMEAISIIALAARSLSLSLCLSFFLSRSVSQHPIVYTVFTNSETDEGLRMLKKQTTYAFCISEQPPVIPSSSKLTKSIWENRSRGKKAVKP